MESRYLYTFTKGQIDSILNELKIGLKDQFKTDEVFNTIKKNIEQTYLSRFR
jgi:hypothetical protein